MSFICNCLSNCFKRESIEKAAAEVKWQRENSNPYADPPNSPEIRQRYLFNEIPPLKFPFENSNITSLNLPSPSVKKISELALNVISRESSSGKPEISDTQQSLLMLPVFQEVSTKIVDSPN